MAPRVLLSALLAVSPLIGADQAAANEFDMDCKIILCLAGGFPPGCEDAWRHLLDRLRDGKSPVDSCTMSDGSELDDVDAEVRRIGAHSSAAWICPAGARLHHEVRRDEEDGHRHVTAFCYEASIERRHGEGYRTTYTGISTPSRVDLQTRVRIAPGTDMAYDTGLLRFDTGRHNDWRMTVRHRP